MQICSRGLATDGVRPTLTLIDGLCMTKNELARFIGLRVRFDLAAPADQFVVDAEECFGTLQGVDAGHHEAIWGESLGVRFVPIASILRIKVESRNV